MKKEYLALLLVLLSISLLSTNVGVLAAGVPNPFHIYCVKATMATTVDPHWASVEDNASCELIQNIYEPLCMFDKLLQTFIAAAADDWPGYGTSGNVMAPSAPDPTAPLETVETWYFHIRANNPWQDDSFDTDYVNASDAEYSFERGMLMDHTGGPMWMLYQPLLNKTSSYDYDLDSNGVIGPAEFPALYNDVTGAIGSNATHVWFNLLNPPTNSADFQKTLCGTWSSIMDEEWCITQGLWDGTNNYANWHATWDPPSPGPLMDPAKAMGSGPYQLDTFDGDPNTGYWRIARHVDYWGNWPAPGSAGYVEYVTTKTVKAWVNRKAQFMSTDPALQADLADVPEGNAGELHTGGVTTTPVLPGFTYWFAPSREGMARHYERKWINGWIGEYSENTLAPGNYYYPMWKGLATTPSDVAVAAYSAEMSPESNITTYLINGAWWAPRPGKPWMKLNDPATNPLVSVTAKVRRTDAVAGTVLVYVTWTGTTAADYTEEFGYATQLMDPGDDLLFGPVNIADTAPLVGKYEVWLSPYVLDDNAVNIIGGGAQNFDAGYFIMKGFCDINGDNVVDGKDFVLVKAAIPSTPGSAKWNFMADVNNSGSGTAADYQLVKTSIPTLYTPA